MNKKTYEYKDIKPLILEGVNTLAEPVIQTLSPRGRNVLFETDKGDWILSNDGITIAKSISVENRIQNSVIDVMREASLRTNLDEGDGTTQTILLSSILVKESLALLEQGYSWIEIRSILNEMGDILCKRLDEQAMPVKTDNDLRNIASISANNDTDIAEHILEVVKVAGLDGMVFIEPTPQKDTVIEKDLGFMIKSGIPHPDLLKDRGRPTVEYTNVPVFITDKRLYHEEEAETILRVAVESGHESIVIIARDIMGKAMESLLTNHIGSVINVLFIKDPRCTETDNTSLQDLAVYLGGNVIGDKAGDLVNSVDENSFVIAKRVFSDPGKTLLTPKKGANKELDKRVKYLKGELKKKPHNEDLKIRLSSLTTGVVTVKVAGATSTEIREKIFRYEDAINAVRSAMKNGYVVGGGICLLNAYKYKDYDWRVALLAERFSQSVFKQIAKNCGVNPDKLYKTIRPRLHWFWKLLGYKQKRVNKNFGYNALTNKCEDLMRADIIDSVGVIKSAIINAISVSNIIISIGHYIINDVKYYERNKDDRKRSEGAESS